MQSSGDTFQMKIKKHRIICSIMCSYPIEQRMITVLYAGLEIG